MKGEESERNYKREKAKQHGWEYRSTQKRRKGKRNSHEKIEVVDKQGLENTQSLHLLWGNHQNVDQY